MSQLSWDSLVSRNGSSWWPPPQKEYVHPEPMHVILFEERVIGDVIKLRMLRWDHPGSGQALNPMTCVLVRGRRGKDTDTREDGVGTQAVMLPQGEEGQTPR